MMPEKQHRNGQKNYKSDDIDDVLIHVPMELKNKDRDLFEGVELIVMRLRRQKCFFEL